MSDELLNRAEAFAALELPGQPQFMHMGTANLVRDLAARVRELEAERASTRDILAGGDYGSLPNDWNLPRIAEARMDDIYKLTWQVRDTCARAERAEAERDFLHKRRGELVIERDRYKAALAEYPEGRDVFLAGALAEVEAMRAENERLRGLLREAREDWIKVGYGASHEDVAACRDFCDRINAYFAEEQRDV